MRLSHLRWISTNTGSTSGASIRLPYVSVGCSETVKSAPARSVVRSGQEISYVEAFALKCSALVSTWARLERNSHRVATVIVTGS